MLASGSAWRVLDAEHDQLRLLLDAIVRNLDGATGKQPGLDLGALRALVQAFQDFETRTHRPKGVVLLESVRGRSADADRLLDEIEGESRTCEQLLSQAVALIEQGLAGGKADEGEIDALLRQHRDLMVQQLEQEDTALRSYTTQLLTSQEWSQVASSISSEVHKPRGRRDTTRR